MNTQLLLDENVKMKRLIIMNIWSKDESFIIR